MERKQCKCKTDSISLFAGIRHDVGDIGYLKGLFSYGRYKNSISRSTGADEYAEGSVNGTLMQLGALVVSTFRLPQREI